MVLYICYASTLIRPPFYCLHGGNISRPPSRPSARIPEYEADGTKRPRANKMPVQLIANSIDIGLG